MDFRNNMQKVYVTEEQKEKFMEKLNRDVEVGEPWNFFLNVTLHCCCCSPLPHSGSISTPGRRHSCVAILAAREWMENSFVYYNRN